MKKTILSLLLVLLSAATAASKETRCDSLPDYGRGHTSSEMFRRYYHTGDLVHYLDNIDDRITYQTETTGSYSLPDQLTFSVAGNSFRWNKYYIDGFRTDSRFFVGSTLYQPDLQTSSIDVDYFGSEIRFTRDSHIPNTAAVSYNIGGLGGISPGTTEFVNLLHLTASQRLYKPIEYRDKMQGAGTVRIDYSIPLDGKRYLQQLYVDFGQRKHTDFNETGIHGFYPENFFKVNLRGQLPLKEGKLFDSWNYLLNVSSRDNLYSEYYYGREETARSDAYSLSVYGTKANGKHRYTSGLTIATTGIRHNNLYFARNLIDQDGEGFEPWYPDGFVTEANYALNYTRPLTRWLDFRFDGYNSLIHFAASNSDFCNAVYMQPTKKAFLPLYVYEWHSESFASGLLENTASLSATRRINPWLDLRADAGLSLDAMILTGKSMFRPNWEIQAGLDIRPCKWFEMEVNLSRQRVSFNWDDIKFFSDKYLNGDIHFWNDRNGDGRYQTDEKGDYFTSTGGKYHNRIKHLRQSSYFVLDLPIYFRFGRHEITFQNTYKKYFDTWYTSFAGDPSQYGYLDNTDDFPVYFLNGGEPVNYEVGQIPARYMKTGGWTNFLTNSPYYISSVIKYQYTGRKFLFSFSWQSFLMAGPTSTANGPLHNNIGSLSEFTANPNNEYKIIGRYDQDRAYIARMQIAYNITENFSLALTGKWKDGQPFSNFETRVATDSKGNSQMALWRGRTKGINPFNGDFGSREDAFYYFDLRATYKGSVCGKYPFEVQAYCYNIYDFGTELHEYTFLPCDYKEHGTDRLAMSLNIPRGLIVSLKIGL